MFAEVRPNPKSFSLGCVSRSAESWTNSTALMLPWVQNGFSGHSHGVLKLSVGQSQRCPLKIKLPEKLGHSDTISHQTARSCLKSSLHKLVRWQCFLGGLPANYDLIRLLPITGTVLVNKRLMQVLANVLQFMLKGKQQDMEAHDYNPGMWKDCNLIVFPRALSIWQSSGTP